MLVQSNSQQLVSILNLLHLDDVRVRIQSDLLLLG